MKCFEVLAKGQPLRLSFVFKISFIRISDNSSEYSLIILKQIISIYIYTNMWNNLVLDSTACLGLSCFHMCKKSPLDWWLPKSAPFVKVALVLIRDLKSWYSLCAGHSSRPGDRRDLFKSPGGHHSSQIVFENMWELLRQSCNLSVCDFGVKENESSKEMYGDQSVISPRFSFVLNRFSR